jgi:lipopolysaccharide transport protein LptA
MNKRIILLAVLAVAGAAVWAATDTPKTKSEGPTEISADHAEYDNTTRRLVYTGNVVVTDAQAKMTCDQLLVDLPMEGQHRPTNIVAEANVIIDFVDDHTGQTNHLTANRAVYEFMIVNSVTNWTVTFTGTTNHPPRIETPDYICLSDPIVRDMATGKLSFVHPDMQAKTNVLTGTNGMPVNFFK